MGNLFLYRLPLFRYQLYQKIRDESGATLVYVALTLPLLIGLSGLIIDGSNLYMQQRKQQSAADAAALAGTRLLSLGQTSAQVNSEVNSLALADGADSVTWSSLNNSKGIQVQTTHTFPSYFAGFIGYTTFTVHARSSANYVTVNGVGDLLPMVTKCDDMANDEDPAFTYGATYTLWDKDMNAPGNFGWVNWDDHANSASELAENIAHPSNSGVWHIGDWLPATTGTKSSSNVRQALDSWIGKAVTIPLYSNVTGSGSNTKYQICSFAQFILMGYDFSGKDKWVRGSFIRSMVRGSSGNGPDFGLRDVRLVQ